MHVTTPVLSWLKTSQHRVGVCQILAYDDQGSPSGFGPLRYLFADTSQDLKLSRFTAFGYNGGIAGDGEQTLSPDRVGPRWSLGTGADGDGHLGSNLNTDLLR